MAGNNGLFYLLLLFVLGACQSNDTKQSGYTHSLNLLEYGVPLYVFTPDRFQVENNTNSLMQELKITATDYLVFVYGYDMAGQPQSEKSKKLVQVKEDPYSIFGELIVESDNGFVYSTSAANDTTLAYNFHRYIRVSNKLYHITSSAGGRRPPFTKKQMIDMYDATAND